MFSGVVIMCMKYECGTSAMKASATAAWKSQTPR